MFLVTTNSARATATGVVGAPVYAPQVVGYYGTAGTAGGTPTSTGTTSGIVTFRFLDRNGGTERTATVDASKGWVYYDLTSNTVSSETGVWQVAFNRYNVKLNGGTSGSSTVAGFVGKTPAGFYGTDGAVVASKFTATTNVADTLADLSRHRRAALATAASGSRTPSRRRSTRRTRAAARRRCRLRAGASTTPMRPWHAAGLADIHMLKAGTGTRGTDPHRRRHRLRPRPALEHQVYAGPAHAPTTATRPGRSSTISSRRSEPRCPAL